MMLHSGSRNVGYRIANVYMEKAKELNAKWHTNLDPKVDLAFLPDDSDEGQEYIKAMNFALDFAKENRRLMMEQIKSVVFNMFEKYVGGKVELMEEVNIHHNYATIENHFGQNVWIHRKGATSAKKGEMGIIPGSMGTASFVIKGRGNKESFMSCSHGGGRAMGRKQAIKNLDLDKFKSQMQGIVCLDIDTAHLDESPEAYKDISVVMSEQTDLVDIVHTLKPIGVAKGKANKRRNKKNKK